MFVDLVPGNHPVVVNLVDELESLKFAGAGDAEGAL